MNGGNSEQAVPKKRRGWRLFGKILLFGASLVLLAGAAAGFGAYLAYEHVTQPGIAGEPVELTIPEGVTGRQAGRLLSEKGLVEHEVLFRLAMRLDTSGRAIKHGPYVLPKGLSPTQLLEILQEGPNRKPRPEEIPDELRVTIPEGLTIAQMAALFDEPEAFLDAARDPELIAKLGIDAPTLEGFLLPNTYFFSKKPTEREVVERMLDEFRGHYAKLRAEYEDGAEADALRLITVASLVEEEAKAEEERGLVAAVIYNRLEKGMPLELDATLQYALGKYGQRLLDEDKEVDSPYNTYRYPGLTPGPISNPGLASIRAALRPADADYLFFVSNADGRTHTFSRTLREHNEAVARYRREIREQRRELRQQEAARE